MSASTTSFENKTDVSVLRSLPGAKPSAGLILMVLASNQMAAITFDSMPYLMTTIPAPMRAARPDPPFEFVKLRRGAPPIIEPKGKLAAGPPPNTPPAPAVGFAPDGEPPTQGMADSNLPAGSIDFEPATAPKKLGPADLPARPAPPKEAFPVVRPVLQDSDVSLESLLPFFIPPPAPNRSSATFRQS